MQLDVSQTPFCDIMYDMKTTNTYAKINLNNLRSNYRFVKSLNPEKEAIAIVKADAYGHGSAECARALYEEGVRYFAVATLDEAEELIASGLKADILILGFVDEDRLEEAVRFGVISGIYSTGYARKLNEEAARQGRTVSVHIKLNTGMNRLGYDPLDPSFRDRIKELKEFKNLSVEGAFSHYSTADEEDLTYSERQRKIFENAVELIKEEGFDLKLIHISNSAAAMIFDCPVSNAFRPGLVLYGYSPLPGERMKEHLKPVMSVYTHIANTFTLKKGESIGYGRKYTADSDRRIATLTTGYADGYLRSFGKEGYVLINGRKAKIRGNVCMDMMMVDITDIPDVKATDIPVLFGEELPATLPAQWAGTIPYEITCGLSKRVTRIYTEE